MQFIQRFLYNTDRQIFGILYINNIYYNNTLHTYVYLNSVQTFFSSVSHALHASGNSKALTPIGRKISLEMSAVYLTLPYLPAPAPLLPFSNGDVSLLGSFHCQPRWATRVTFFLSGFLHIAPSTFSLCRRRPVKPCSPCAVPRDLEIARSIACTIFN